MLAKVACPNQALSGYPPKRPNHPAPGAFSFRRPWRTDHSALLPARPRQLRDMATFPDLALVRELTRDRAASGSTWDFQPFSPGYESLTMSVRGQASAGTEGLMAESRDMRDRASRRASWVAIVPIAGRCCGRCVRRRWIDAVRAPKEAALANKWLQHREPHQHSGEDVAVGARPFGAAITPNTILRGGALWLTLEPS